MEKYELELQQRLRLVLQEVCEAYVEWDGWPNGLWRVVLLIRQTVSSIVDDMELSRLRRRRKRWRYPD